MCPVIKLVRAAKAELHNQQVFWGGRSRAKPPPGSKPKLKADKLPLSFFSRLYLPQRERQAGMKLLIIKCIRMISEQK